MDRNQGGTGQSSGDPHEPAQTLPAAMAGQAAGPISPIIGEEHVAWIDGGAKVMLGLPEGSGLPDDSRRLRTREEAEKVVGVFLKAVGIRNDLKDFTALDTDILLRLMEQTVLNIHWYNGKIERGCVLYNIYLVLTVGLMLSIPLLAIGVHSMIGGTSDLSWPGTVIAVLTSLLAAQGLMKQAYDHRFRFAAFWEARSKITTAYLDLIACWRAHSDCVAPGPASKLVLTPDFRSAIERTIEKAETILAEEKRIFFTGLQLPQIEPSVIAGTRTVVANLFKDSSALATLEMTRARDCMAQAAAKVPEETAVRDSN